MSTRDPILDTEQRERDSRRERTPRAAELIEQGHEALNRCLDEELRQRITNALVLVGSCVFVGRDIPEEEAETVHRIFMQANADLVLCGNEFYHCAHDIEDHGGAGCRVKDCECPGFRLRGVIGG